MSAIIRIRDFGRVVEITTPSGVHTLTLSPRARAAVDKLESRATDHRCHWNERCGAFTDYTFDDEVDDDSCPYYDEDPRANTWYASRARSRRVEAYLSSRD